MVMGCAVLWLLSAAAVGIEAAERLICQEGASLPLKHQFDTGAEQNF